MRQSKTNLKEEIMRTRSVILAFVFLIAAVPAFADSGRVQNAANGHWYQRFDTTKTWQQARNFCKSLGGYTASIRSQQENDFVYGSLCSQSSQWCWIGATDSHVEGIWNWISGLNLTYTNWAGGEPNNCNGIEHYLMYFTPPDGRAGSWNDLGTGYNAQGVPGGCGCGGCANEWYAMSTVCEWDLLPPRVMGLLNWWPGNGNASDVVGGNDGTMMGGAGFVPGLVDRAFSLNGSNAYVSVPDRPNLNFGDRDFSIALWVNFNTLEGEQVMIEKYVETLMLPSYGWTLTKIADNNIVFAGGPKAPYDMPNYLSVTPPDIRTGVWNLVAATRTGNHVTIYWNGNPLGSANIAFNPDSGSTLKIGHRGNPSDTPGSNDTRGFYLNGLADEVMIFNHALTPEEVANLYTVRDPNAAPY